MRCSLDGSVFDASPSLSNVDPPVVSAAGKEGEAAAAVNCDERNELDASASANDNSEMIIGGKGAATTPDEESYEEDEDERELRSMASNMCSDGNWLHILYLSLFSTIGVTMRAFIGRFFGGDCSSNSLGQPINDFLWPLSHKICVTTDGRTEQYGGALFIDLPANMVGSFIMGLMTGHDVDWPVMPCLSHDHPLQDAKGFHVGIKTALCGSLTTFSSWNSQMVLMMDGTANPFLGSQVLAALFGYTLGLQVSLHCFRAGRTLASWLHLRKNPHIFDSALSMLEMRPRWHHKHVVWMTPVAVSIIIFTLIILYMLGDFYWGIAHYRILWIACLAAPIGTIFRWKLSTLNGKFSIRGLFWFPMGTFLANFLGSILSAALSAWAIIESSHKGAERWEIPVIKAASLGIAGSLSTVSTFAKECVEIGEKNPQFDSKAFLYSHGTMLCCCFVGLLVYSPLVRFV